MILPSARSLKGQWQRLKRSGEASHVFLQDLGSKVSVAKSVLFSSSAHTRKIMRIYHWKTLGCRIQTAVAARDLGAHINFGKRKRTNTLVARMKCGAKCCKRVSAMPASLKIRLRGIRGKCLPLALYGSETTPLQFKAVRELNASIKKGVSIGCHPTTNARLLNLTLGV